MLKFDRARADLLVSKHNIEYGFSSIMSIPVNIPGIEKGRGVEHTEFVTASEAVVPDRCQ